MTTMTPLTNAIDNISVRS